VNRPVVNSVHLLLALALACAPREVARQDTTPPAPPTKALPAGEGMLPVDAGTIWYKVSGAASTGTPVILIHGGPGFSSYYFKPLEAISDDRPVVRYDQSGSGKSGKLTDTTKFTIDHFVRELDSLRAHLGYDRVHLLGHSWGTIVALEYFKLHPEHVASLTLASAFIDLPAWTRNGRRFIRTLSDSSRRAIASRESDGHFDAPDYQAAMGEYYGKYLVRHPVIADQDSTFANMNDALYNYMQGPSEFTIVGTLQRYDGTPYLKNVHVPLLYTVGEFDEADPPTIKRFAAMTPGARVEVIPNSAHLTMWDNGPVMTRVVRDFLRGADSAVKR
jgi:proline iminopeptidase